VEGAVVVSFAGREFAADQGLHARGKIGQVVRVDQRGPLDGLNFADASDEAARGVVELGGTEEFGVLGEEPQGEKGAVVFLEVGAKQFVAQFGPAFKFLAKAAVFGAAQSPGDADRNGKADQAHERDSHASAEKGWELVFEREEHRRAAGAEVGWRRAAGRRGISRILVCLSWPDLGRPGAQAVLGAAKGAVVAGFRAVGVTPSLASSLSNVPR
jgi:hypothetical protein